MYFSRTRERILAFMPSPFTPENIFFSSFPERKICVHSCPVLTLFLALVYLLNKVCISQLQNKRWMV